MTHESRNTATSRKKSGTPAAKPETSGRGAMETVFQQYEAAVLLLQQGKYEKALAALEKLLPGAPAVFRSGSAGPVTNIPTVVRISNGQLVTNANPIHPRDQLSIYLTGLGATLPSVATGQPAPSNPLALTIAPPLVTLGGVQLPVMYSGLAPGEIGVYQINVSVPRGVPAGMSIPLQISQAGDSTSLNVRVLN